LKDFQGLLKDPMNPASDSMATLSVLVPDRMTPTLAPKSSNSSVIAAVWSGSSTFAEYIFE